MAVYRYQCVSVGMWRGQIKRWNTTFHASNTGLESNIRGIMQQSGWPNPGDVTGACSGGVASVTCYASAGGPPINRVVYFDWQVPSTWIPYTGTAWSAIDPDTPLDASGESAAIVVGKLPGLSASGKPLSTRKYLHAIPSRTAAGYADPDIPSATATAIAALFSATYMRSPSGVAPTSVSVEPYYGNHQRVRGRRRTASQVAAGAFTAGVVAGSGAPFPEPRIEFLEQ